MRTRTGIDRYIVNLAAGLFALAAVTACGDELRLNRRAPAVARSCPRRDCWEVYSYPCPQPPQLIAPEGEGRAGDAFDSDETESAPAEDSLANGTGVTQTPSPGSSSVSGGTGSSSTPGSAAPNMIGDTLGGACGTAFFEGLVEGAINHPNFASCSRQKIAENNSPLPRDRVYFGYNHFHNAIYNFTTDDDGPRILRADSDTSVDRFTVGMEKTFLDGVFSVDVRMPTAQQLGTNLLYDFRTPPSAPDDRDYQLGNITVALKSLLYASDSGLYFSGGFLLETPTSSDVHIRSLEAYVEPGLNVASDYRFDFANDSVFLSPFLGFLYAPESPYFLQGFWQTDTPLHGADLAFDLRDRVNGFTQQLQSQVHFSGETSMRFDLGGGAYLYRDTTGGGWLNYLAFVVEAHYSTTIQDADIYSVNTPFMGNNVVPGFDPNAEIVLGNQNNRFDILNFTFGPTVLLQDGTSIATGFVLPTDTGEEKPFDFEFQLQVNRFY